MYFFKFFIIIITIYNCPNTWKENRSQFNYQNQSFIINNNKFTEVKLN